MTRWLHTRLAAVVLAGVAGTADADAQQTGVVNARVEMRSAARGLEPEIGAAVARATPLWIGYRVPVVQRPRTVISGTGSYGRCHLEPATELLVLARADAGRIAELRSSGVDCDLDAGGMPLVWLTDVSPDQSVAWLKSMIDGAARFNDQVLAAIALHDAPTAGPTLIALARQDSRAPVRSKALFWVAQRASEDASRTIAGAIDDDPDIEVKKKAVFALSQLPRDQGVPLLIDLARNNRTPAVRRQAMFWLGQSNDQRAVDFFASILVK